MPIPKIYYFINQVVVEILKLNPGFCVSAFSNNEQGQKNIKVRDASYGDNKKRINEIH